MEFIRESNRIYLTNEEGVVIAEITFPELKEGVCTINHTFVDASLRGQGVAGMLMEAAVETIQKQGKQIEATCSYAIGWLEKQK